MKQPCEGPTGAVIISNSRVILETFYENTQEALIRSRTSKAALFRWLKDHGITYTERSFNDWSKTAKNKRVGAASTLVMSAIATRLNYPLQEMMFGRI